MEQWHELCEHLLVDKFDTVLDLTAHGRYAKCGDVLSGLTTHHCAEHENGSYSGYSSLIFCERELPKGSVACKPMEAKRIISACAQPHLTADMWLYVPHEENMHVYICHMESFCYMPILPEDLEGKCM